MPDDDGDVGQSAGDRAGHQIAGLVAGRSGAHWQGGAAATKERLQIGYAPVVNVRVGLLQAPLFRVGGEFPAHVHLQPGLVEGGVAKASGKAVIRR